MINLQTEKLILFSQLPKHLPPQPSGKSVHLSACYRWMRHGCCGVRLETIFVAGSRYTSEEAVNRFWAQVTDAKDNRSRSGSGIASKSDKELSAAGW